MANGWPENQVVEIIDLKNPSSTCANLPNFPIQTSNIAGAGIVKDNVPMICTSYHGCYALKPKKWTKAANLKINRGHASKGNVVLDGKLYISGGLFRGKAQKSSELVSTKESIFGPELPKNLFHHCTIKLNETTILITGGQTKIDKQSVFSNDTIFQNVITGKVSFGPQFNKKKIKHKCGKFSFEGKTYALTTSSGTDMEVLDLENPQDGWQVILDKSKRGDYTSTKGFEIVVLNEKDVYIVSGNRVKVAISKLNCVGKDLKNCKWKELRQTLRVGRSYPTVIPIPDSVANDFC